MDVIKNWASVMIIVSVIGTIVLVLSPSGSIEKQVKTAVSIVMLVVCLSPFLSGLKDVKISDFKFNKNEEVSTIDADNTALLFEENLKDEIITCLHNNNIYIENIDVEMLLNDNELSISRAAISISEANLKDKEKILTLLSGQFGIIAEIEVVS